MSDKIVKNLTELVDLLKANLLPASPKMPKLSNVVGKDNAVKQSSLAPSLRMPGQNTQSKTQQLATSASSKSQKDPFHQAKHIQNEAEKSYAMTQANAQKRSAKNPLAFGKSEAEEKRFYILKDDKLISHSPKTEQEILSEYGSFTEAEKQGLKIVPVVQEYLKTGSNGQWNLLTKSSDDEIDKKIQAKIRAEMDKRKFGEADAIRHVIDRDRGEKQAQLDKPKAPKAPKPPKLLQTESVKKDDSVKPFGESVYNSVANLPRKATRTGEERAELGRNVGVRSYTTSGSATQAAREARENKKQKRKSIKTLRTLKDMSAEEIDAIKAKHGLK